MNEQDRKALKEAFLLGVLFHDIGKVVQRANTRPSSKKHQEWGYDWLLEHLPKDLAFRETCALIALLHHAVSANDEKAETLSVFRNKSNLTLMAYMADNLSAEERKPVSEIHQEYGKWQSDLALSSVFSRVSLTHDDENSKINYNDCWNFLPMEMLSTNKINFPQKDVSLSRQNYAEILTKLEVELAELGSSLNTTNALVLLEKHLSFVPSLTLGIYDDDKDEVLPKHPDISLYDHSRVAAGIAACFWNYFAEHDDYGEKFQKDQLLEKEILDEAKKTERFLLIGGDLSGIQNFIYTISSWKALRNLKARSVYLELMTEHIINELLQELRLCRANVIYAGGGRFYVLAHNSQNALEAIAAIRKKTSDWLYHAFRGTLSLNLVATSFSSGVFDLQENKLAGLWSDLAALLEDQKSLKFNDHLADFLTAKEVEEYEKQCEVCHRDDIKLLEFAEEYEAGDTHFLCQSCYDLTQFGRAVQNCLFIEILDARPEENSVEIVGTFYVPRKTLAPQSAAFVINNLDVSHYKSENKIPLWIGNFQALQNADLQAYADKSYGADKLAILRMDIDNLGKMFIRGLAKNERSFSRMAALSRTLNLFFKLGINALCAERCASFNPLKKTAVYQATVVYSGGDDLFLLGAWDDVIELSLHINRSFRQYTCHNRDISISAGVVVRQPQMPIYQLADLSERAETAAKENGKNSLALFYDPVEQKNRRRTPRIWNWRQFETAVQPIFQDLIEFGAVERLQGYARFEPLFSKSFIHKARRLAESVVVEGKLVLPRMAWAIARIKKPFDDELKKLQRRNPEKAAYLMAQWQEVFKNKLLGFKTQQYIEVPLIWLELLTRKRGGE